MARMDGTGAEGSARTPGEHATSNGAARPTKSAQGSGLSGKDAGAANAGAGADGAARDTGQGADLVAQLTQVLWHPVSDPVCD